MTNNNKTTNTGMLKQRYAAVADGIALLFSGYAEIVIHDLASQSVVYIANNISKRQLGDASALEEVDFSQTSDVIGPYEKLNWDGHKIRSTSVVLRDDNFEAIGMLCINMSIGAFEAAREMLELFLGSNKVIPQPEILFHDDWQERINTFTHAWLKEHKLSINILTHANKRQLVEALFHQGAFNGKSAANYIANILNMGRATVFKYLKEIKQQA
ncbi:helix-turn-helix transcriptional regulator [Thalassomonas actiniarum]|uniref:PAS domain-containing protein n=1 Tax=Thalassomonas actiniarum TaxID=485447 RepID=A0AAF0C2D9_9GAMM|nr:PAS domain-containing protein [Thalassomonas actiniarum]WDD97674.1 PAS domain-containing protein [Thalassomonas actiniarum]